MGKFAGYPIVVNYNLHTQKRYRYKEDNLHKMQQYEEERQLSIKVNTTSDSNLENNLWKKEVDEYEAAVYQCLRKIDNNPVGRMVLGLINKRTTVWIIPKSDEDLKACTCAMTRPLKYEIPRDGSYAYGVGSGDTLITFRPELGDDTLFHELVHAYRYSRNKYHPMLINTTSGRLYDRRESAKQNTEEFFAHQMGNIYLSQKNRPLTAEYLWDWVSDKNQIYEFLLDNVEMLMTLKYFLHHEYLAMLAAHSFTTDYNPFRDYGMLEAKYMKDTSYPGFPTLPTLPEMGKVLQVQP